MVRSAGRASSVLDQNTRLSLPPCRPFVRPSAPLSPSARTMSQTHPIASSSNFQPIFNAALEAYEKRTKTRLLTHPLAGELQSCDSPTAILSVLEGLVQQFDLRRRSDQRLTDWLNPTVTVLYAFNDLLRQVVVSSLVSLILFSS